MVASRFAVCFVDYLPAPSRAALLWSPGLVLPKGPRQAEAFPQGCPHHASPSHLPGRASCARGEQQHPQGVVHVVRELRQRPLVGDAGHAG